MSCDLTTRIYWIVAALLFLAGPVVGIVAGRFVEHHQDAETQLVFEEQFTKQAFLFEKQIAAYIEVLGGVKSFFESSDFVTRDEFYSFTKASLDRHPEVQAIEWVPRVTEQMRPAHESQAKSTGLAEYRITAMSSDGSLVRAPTCDVYFPVYYMEPVAGNLAALGYDLGSESARRRAIISAIDQPRAVLADPVNLVQGHANDTGMLIFLRVRSNPISGTERDDGRCQGLVLLVFDLEKVINSSLLANAYLDPSSYAFEMIDLDVNGAPAVLFSHPGFPEAAPATDLEVSHAIEIGGQKWSLAARPTAPFLAQHASLNPVFIGVAAASIWEMIWISLVALAHWSKTGMVKRKDRVLDSILLSMAEGIVVADTNGHITLANHSAVLLLGLGVEHGSANIETLSSRCRLPDKTTVFPSETFPLARAIRGEHVRDAVLWVPPVNLSDRGIWLSANAAPLLSPEGVQHGGVLVLRDISRSKRSQEFSERMANAVAETDDAVFVTTTSGDIEYVNTAFERTTGFSREEALGRKPSLLKSHMTTPEHYRKLWSTILRGEVFRGMIANRKKSGEVYYADQTITPMRDLGGKITHFVAVSKDMTEYRLLQKHESAMEVAASVQQRFYPKKAPTLGTLDIAGAVFSADTTCGDYFDFIPMAGNRICLTVGDVSGHGIGAALVMAQTRAYMRTMCDHGYCPGDVLTRINRNLIADLSDEQFVTLILACIDTDAGHLIYSSAGHDTCFLIDGNAQIKNELGSTGLPLGMFDVGEYPTSRKMEFQEGDVLFLLTDGLADCQAHLGRFLDIGECLSLIHRHRHEPAAVIVERIHEHVRGFVCGESQNDDITVVICKFGPRPIRPD